MVRRTLKILQQMLQDFKRVLTIFGDYALKGYISLFNVFIHQPLMNLATLYNFPLYFCEHKRKICFVKNGGSKAWNLFFAFK